MLAPAPKSKPPKKDDWATNGMATRDSDQRNLVKSLNLDPTELNRHNLCLKAKYDRMKREEIRYEAYKLFDEILSIDLIYNPTKG